MSDAALITLSIELGSALGAQLQARPARRVHGGCINESYRWESSAGPLFVKLSDNSSLSVFEAEAAGLHELAAANAVRVPEVLAVGATDQHAYLALEWIDLTTPSLAAEVALGEQLARQHRKSSASFGWDRDNTIGSTPQRNTRTADWVEFLRKDRLGYQLSLARTNGYGGQLQQRAELLLERLETLFAGYRPQPALLHGDLWGGNWGMDRAGRPAIFDPAVYYGDREADVAMTRLFGGFGARFYSAYQDAWPLDEGAMVRVDLYNLYHLLNHLNLFGTGYLAQSQAAIERLLAHC